MIDDKDRRGIASALFESAKSTFGRVKIGAVLYSKAGHAVSWGYNQRKTHPRQYEANKRAGKQIENPCLHAEIDAIVSMSDYGAFCDYEEPHTIYVARLDRNGKWANCKPCAACHSEIVAAGIKRVVYTTEEGVKEYACG
jgi:deoxycytidylate deaminase